VVYPPEVSALSQLAWRKSAEGYMLSVNRDLVSIAQDLRGDWQIRGSVNGTPIEMSAQNLPGAFNIADSFIPKESIGYLKRDVRWRGDPPTDKQLGLCRKLGIVVPPGITKGQVSVAIDAKMMKRESQPATEVYRGEY